MKQLHFLVTGASGFVGRHLVPHLLRQGHRVTAAVRHPGCGLPVPAVEAVVGDLAGPVEWDRVLQGVDVVVHLAGKAHDLRRPKADAILEYRRVHVGATRTLAAAAARAGIRRFVFISSVKAIGERTENGKCFTDTTPPNPSEIYGISKLEAERALFLEAADSPMEVTILRPPLIHGPGVKGNFERLIRCIQAGWPMPLGRIDNMRSVMGVGNFCEVIEIAASHPDTAGKTFLVADSPAISTPELIWILADSMNKSARLISIPV